MFVPITTDMFHCAFSRLLNSSKNFDSISFYVQIDTKICWKHFRLMKMNLSPIS